MVKDSQTEDAPSERVRLQKLLASAGVDSRRKCEEYIVAGRVTVDGEVVSDLGQKVDPASQDIRLDGERLRPRKKRYFLLNKPAGYLCTNYDPNRRPKAVDLVPAGDTRLFTVGRLDESSEGLLIVTNDGDFAQRLAHPRYQVPRVYRVQVAGVPTPETLTELRKGVYFTEGRFGLKRAKKLKTHGKSTFLEVELNQGHNREIRRLFARFGHKVMWLQRIAFGPLRLGDLPSGRSRPLKPAEIKALTDIARTEEKRTPSARPQKPRRSAKAGAKRKAARPAAARRILDMSGGESPKRENPKPRTHAGRPPSRKPTKKPRGKD